MRIGELAERTDTSRRLLRYYEEHCPEEGTPEMIAALEAERQRMNDRIQFLTRNRDAITAYIDAVRSTRITATLTTAGTT